MTSPFPDELISAYLDDELPGDERARVEKALRGSAELQRLHDDLQTLRTTLQSLPVVDPAADLAERVLRQAERRAVTGLDAASRPETQSSWEIDEIIPETVTPATRGRPWALARDWRIAAAAVAAAAVAAAAVAALAAVVLFVLEPWAATSVRSVADSGLRDASSRDRAETTLPKYGAAADGAQVVEGGLAELAAGEEIRQMRDDDVPPAPPEARASAEPEHVSAALPKGLDTRSTAPPGSEVAPGNGNPTGMGDAYGAAQEAEPGGQEMGSVGGPPAPRPDERVMRERSLQLQRFGLASLAEPATVEKLLEQLGRDKVLVVQVNVPPDVSRLAEASDVVDTTSRTLWQEVAGALQSRQRREGELLESRGGGAKEEDGTALPHDYVSVEGSISEIREFLGELTARPGTAFALMLPAGDVESPATIPGGDTKAGMGSGEPQATDAAMPAGEGQQDMRRGLTVEAPARSSMMGQPPVGQSAGSRGSPDASQAWKPKSGPGISTPGSPAAGSGADTTGTVYIVFRLKPESTSGKPAVKSDRP